VLTVQGEKGALTRAINSAVDLQIKDGIVAVIIISNDKTSRSLQGLTRTLVANMITGVNAGFERVLEINGIGYRAELKGKTIVLNTR
jgi:large subunit ribosomal protein L6